MTVALAYDLALHALAFLGVAFLLVLLGGMAAVILELVEREREGRA